MTIKELRMDRALTRGAFAKSLGISLSALDGYESNRRRVSDKVLMKIREVYGVDLSESTPPAAAEPSDGQPADEAAGVPVEKAAENAVDTPVEEVVAEAVGASMIENAGETVDTPVEETADEVIGVPAEDNAKENAIHPVEIAAEEAVDVPAVENAEEEADSPVEDAVEDIAAAPIEEIPEETVDTPTEEAVEDATAVPVVENTEEAVDIPIEETAENAVGIPTEETVDDTMDAPSEEYAAEAVDVPNEQAAEDTVVVPAEEVVEDTTGVSAEEDATAGEAEVIAPEEETARISTEEEAARIAAEEKAARKAAKRAAKKQKADEEAAQWVADAINALSSITDTFDEDVVAAARSAYDSLTDDQEDLIPGDLVSILIKAEQQIEEATKTFPIADCWITVKDVSYTGKKIKRPSVKVEFGETKLKEDCDYTYKYDKKARDIGMYALTVKGKGRFTGSVDVPFYVVPKAKTLYKLLEGDKQTELTWKCLNNIKGYQIEYSLKEDFSDSKKVTIKKSKAFAKAIGKLKSGKKYYARIRIYAKVDGKKYHSDWSKVKTIKT